MDNPKLRTYFDWIYNEIQGSRSVRRDAGFVTGPAFMLDGVTPWYRNVDELPPFIDWMGGLEECKKLGIV